MDGAFLRIPLEVVLIGVRLRCDACLDRVEFEVVEGENLNDSASWWLLDHYAPRVEAVRHRVGGLVQEWSPLPTE